MEARRQHLGFTGASRHIVDEEEIQLTSVGVDIGSSTTHLIFSRLVLEQQHSRYVVVSRTVLKESEILLTPYVDEIKIDVEVLEEFINRQYQIAGLTRDQVDTGALILTGVALRRRNARAIGELFAEEAGRFVSVSALEATMAAHGSGAVARSGSSGGVTLNIDVGGGTSKFALCAEGRVREVTAIDVGARLVAFDENNNLTRIEEAGRIHGASVGLELTLGQRVGEEGLRTMASNMADRLFEVIAPGALSSETQSLLRLPPFNFQRKVESISFSGGVSEFIYGKEPGSYGDLGSFLAAEVRKRVESLGIPIIEPAARIRATAIGASQYTVQVSGSTIFVNPPDILPVRSLPVVTPEFSLEGEEIRDGEIKSATERALNRMDLLQSSQPIAVAFHWEGSATFARLQGFCSGLKDALEKILAKGHPLVLVSDGDIGGVLGLHLKEEMQLENPVISIDGIDLREFDYIDIGALIQSSGAVPVVIKSLVFPS
jgi:ethanolamine utilization protein EutA